MSLLGKSKSAPTIGIDIGTSLIKVVEARPGRDGAQITAVGIGPTPPGTLENELIVDPQALGDAIRGLLKESGIGCKRCVSSVAGQSSVVVRIIEVPKMSSAELAETMKWEVERHVPFSADQVTMDYQAITRSDDDPDAQNMEVLLAVAQEDVINKHVETLLAAGLEPVAIDVEPLAACRSLIDAADPSLKQKTIAVIGIGASSTELGIFKDGLLAFPRTLPIAGSSLTKAISQGLGVSMEEAERIKREEAAILMDRAASINAMPILDEGNAYGVSDSTVDLSGMNIADGGFIPGLGFMGGNDASAGNAMPDFDIDIAGGTSGAPALDFDLSDSGETGSSPSGSGFDLSGQDAQTSSNAFDMASFNSGASSGQTSFSQEQVFDAMAPALGDLISEIRRSLEYYGSRFLSQPDGILLCGGTAKLKDIDKLIESELGIPVTLANPLQNVTIFSNKLSEGYMEEISPVLSVGVGLAIRDMIGE